MKKSIFSILFIAISFLSFSQSKTNFAIAKQIHENNINRINVFIKGDIATIKALTESNNGIFKYSAGDIAVIEIEVNRLSDFISNKRINRIEAYPQNIKQLNDTLLIHNAVLPVHAGQAPLTQSYDGSGVIVGFIDTGIDFSHPDFKDSLGKTRVKYLWDQTKTIGGTTPLPYNYGQEWNNTQIDAGLASSHSDAAYSHGTHVAGIAVGNGRSTATHKGVAPNADIVFVAIDFNSTSATLITDAVNYIYSKAQQMGKPCVINGSLGDYMGSHDGMDLQAQLIKNMMNLQPGRAFVAAAGNAGNDPYHLGYTVSADTNFTLFTLKAPSIYFQVWSDTADFKNVSFSIGADQMSPYSYRGRIPFSKINAHLGIFRRDTLYNSLNNRIGVIESYGDIIGGTYSMVFNIIPDSTLYKWRFIATGVGKFDLWSDDDMLTSGLPSASIMTDSMYYKKPDTDKTIVSSFQCLDDVITVANYTNRAQYMDVNNTLYKIPTNVPGKIDKTSSHGPTRDGRNKPDIASPGDMTLSAVVISLKPTIIANFPDALALGGFHVRSGATSNACPGVAGVAALYLQKNPTATATMVKQAITNCARQDAFTGSSLPNNIWGYGKVDAFKVLTQCAPNEIQEMSKISSFSVYPNPASQGNNITVELKNKTTAISEIKIYNTIGELVKTTIIHPSQTKIELKLERGIYFVEIIQNNSKTGSQKVIVL